ncbi:MAG TPA: glycosyltransferase [Gemmatimonadaceae bacterium]|nr:glycosyltransferase [Gemmatimonadaceae bacterium]
MTTTHEPQTQKSKQVLGAINRADRLLSAFDVFVLSSRTEGTPIVLFEAMAAAIPVVATAVGGIPDVVGPAEATLVQPEDAVSLAEGIRRTLIDPDAARARAAAAHDRLVSAFAPEPWLDRYEEIYNSVWRPLDRSSSY